MSNKKPDSNAKRQEPPKHKKKLHTDDKTNSERIDTGSSASTKPQRAVDKRTK